jgi:hypothetical protein
MKKRKINDIIITKHGNKVLGIIVNNGKNSVFDYEVKWNKNYSSSPHTADFIENQCIKINNTKLAKILYNTYE